MKDKTSREVPGENAASREEIEKAIQGLTAAELLKLENFAKFRIRGLGRKATGRDHKDLLQQAITSTLQGAEGGSEGRKWNKTVPFVIHLRGALRSISDHWRVEFDDSEAFTEADVLTENEDGSVHSPIEEAASSHPSQERIFLGKEELGRVFSLFKDDDDAILVLEGWAERMTGPEIVEGLGLSKERYEAAVKKIRYRVRKASHE